MRNIENSLFYMPAEWEKHEGTWGSNGLMIKRIEVKVTELS